MLAALAALVVLVGPAAAQPDFGDLILGVPSGGGSFGTSPLVAGAGAAVGTDALDWRAADHPTMPGWAPLQRQLLDADKSLNLALEAYLGVIRTADEQGSSFGSAFHFGDLAHFRTATGHADRLSETLEKAARDLVAAGEALPALEKQGEPMWALEGRCEWVRQVTMLRQLHAWAGARRMKFNGPAWGDSQARPVLATSGDIQLPALPNKVGVRSGTVLTSRATEALVSGYVEAADGALTEAQEARTVLEREAVERSRGSSGWIYLTYNTASLFDVLVKPQAAQFMSGLARAKAALNAAIQASEAHNHGGTSDVSRDALRRVMRGYAEQVAWGEYHYLQGSASGDGDRSLYVLDGKHFGDTHRVDTGGPESEYLEWLLKENRARASRKPVVRP